MKKDRGQRQPRQGFDGCPLSRRRFLAGCAACLGGVGALSARAQPSGESRKVRARLVFSHTTPDRITWPNIGYDYEAHTKQFAEQLGQACPQIEFLPVWTKNAAEAKKIMEEDKQVDGYVVYMAGMGGGGPALIPLLGAAGRPTVLVDHLYAGGGQFLSANATARGKGWKVIGLAASRFEDIAEVVRRFAILKEPGAAADDFFAAAEAVRRKNIPSAGDISCAEDAPQIRDIGECLEKLRNSKILVVGKDQKALGGAIEQIFGAKVVGLEFSVLDQAWRNADREEAAAWADRWIGEAEKIVEPARDDIVKSGAMCVAMRGLMRQHDAQAITVHCLRGFYSGSLQAYPCLGFCQFNNDGSVGACEADLSSTITMLAVGCLTGRPGMISDPVFDTSKNQVIYAHCVAPSKVFGPQGPSNPFHIRSHSEDRRGAAVRSLMPLGYMTTTLKFIPTTRKAVLHQGKAVANIDEDRACRTKLAVELKGDIDKLLNGWSSGWHRVTFYGDLKAPIQELCQALGVTLIEEA